MSIFEKWIVRRIFKQQVAQGYDHNKRITKLYIMIREAVEKEFDEDNKPTRDAYLTELFEKSL